jgi:hypothetical protein
MPYKEEREGEKKTLKVYKQGIASLPVASFFCKNCCAT